LEKGKGKENWIRGGFVEILFSAWRLGSRSGSWKFYFFGREGDVVAFSEREGIKRDALFGMRDGWGFGGIVGRCGKKWGWCVMVHGDVRMAFWDVGFEGLLL
jgi:hypothetical protein